MSHRPGEQAAGRLGGLHGIYYLNNGTNTFEIRQDEGDSATGLEVRRLYASREGTYDEGENVALNAAASASSAATGSRAGAVNDGCAAGGPNEWVSSHEASGCWVQLDWNQPQTIHKIVLYDRPDLVHRVNSGTLTFSDGSSPLIVGHLEMTGKPAAWLCSRPGQYVGSDCPSPGPIPATAVWPSSRSIEAKKKECSAAPLAFRADLTALVGMAGLLPSTCNCRAAKCVKWMSDPNIAYPGGMCHEY